MFGKKYISVVLVIFSFLFLEPSLFAKSVNAQPLSDIMIPNDIRSFEYEVTMGLGYDFFMEKSIYNDESYFSLLHGLISDFGFAFFPSAKSHFGFAFNVMAGFPFGILSNVNIQQVSIDYSSAALIGFIMNDSVGCSFRYKFDKNSILNAFLGAAFDYYYVSYDVGIEQITRKNLQNMIFGLQSRISYEYSFNYLVSLRMGLIFDYDFYSLAQIKYPENYVSYNVFVLMPFCDAVIKF